MWGNKKFLQVSLSPASQSNKRMSARRFGRAVVVAAADYYSTLGVPKSANSKEIKAAYRKLARQVLGGFWVHYPVFVLRLIVISRVFVCVLDEFLLQECIFLVYRCYLLLPFLFVFSFILMSIKNPGQLRNSRRSVRRTR